LTTPEQHNKYIAYSNIAYGSLMAAFGLLMLVILWGMMALPPGGPPVGVLIFFSLFVLLVYSVMIVPSFIASWALLKRKKWARTASIVAAVVAASNFPIGTAVCVYTFWFLFSDQGKYFFDQTSNSSYALPPGRQTWANENWQHDQQRQRESSYQPPPPPPDWR
jgi:hypothetical protein